MKKLICLTLALFTVLSLAGCIGAPEDTSPADTTQAVTNKPETTLPAVTETKPSTTVEPGELTDEEYIASFVPVLRFISCSDVHFEDGNTVERDRFNKMCEIAYAEAEKDTKYNKVDAFCFSGDIANTGTETQFKAFKKFCDKNKKGDTQFLPTLGNHEFFGNPDPISTFKNIFGLEKNYTVTINGFKFILITPDNGGAGYSSETRKWLDAELAATDPNMPVFVFQHHHITNTVYGGDSGWGLTDLHPTLKKYPQVVDFSGHSHFPINDPKSIWQKEYTALGTGTLSYYEMAMGTENGIFPTGNNGEYIKNGSHKDAAQFYIVEADKNGALLIKMYDILSDSYMCAPYFIRTPGDKASFTYTTKERKEASTDPYFKESDAIKFGKINDTSASVCFPQATQDGTNDVVWYYQINVYDASGNKFSSVKRLSDYYYLPMIKQITLSVTGLKAGSEYKVEIIAHNCWEKVSKPLTGTFKTTGTFVPDDGSVPEADIFNAVITADGITNKADGAPLEKRGEFSLADGEVTFDRKGYFIYEDIESKYYLMSESVTIECLVKLDSFNSPYTNPFANMEAGGIGFECTPEGKMQFYIMVNGNYYYPAYQIETGKYYHLVGTYDGEAIKFYVDGVLRDSVTIKGSISWPTNTTAQYLCIGSDSGDGGVSSFDCALTGGIKIARIYAKVLNSTQIENLYKAIK